MVVFYYLFIHFFCIYEINTNPHDSGLLVLAIPSLKYTILYTILYYTKLYNTILYYTILYYTILYHTIPYYTILY